MVCPFWKIFYNQTYEVRDLTGSLVTEVCHNVATQPSLQPITSETFLLHLPTQLMMLIWILRPEAFGVGPGCIF